MLLHALLAPVLLAAAPPTLQPSRVLQDRDGTWRAAAGLHWKAPAGQPEAQARAFLDQHGARLGIRGPLALDGVLDLGNAKAVRLVPQRGGYSVRGAGVTVLVGADGAVELAARGQAITGPAKPFVLSARDAAQVALAHGPAGLSPELSVTELAARARRFQQALPDGSLVPVYVLDVPSTVPAWSAELGVDGRDGALLWRRLLAANEVPTHAKVYDPAPTAPGQGTLLDVELTHLKDPPPHGTNLTGDFVETFNCCKRYECVAGPDGGCATKRCVSASADAGVESRTVLQLATADLALPSQVALACPNLPDPVFLDTAFCAELPKASSAGGDWTFSPMDLASPEASALASEEDDFAEVMAYYHVQKFLDHAREFSGNGQFCLDANHCSAGVPSAPFHVAVNSLLPKIDQDALTQLICQVCAIPMYCPAGSGGKGTQANPAKLDGFMRVANAAFIPALQSGQLPLPVTGEVLNRPFDSLVLFQGPTRDFAYDGDVIYHETTHAVIHTVVRNAGEPAGLNGYLLDTWGVHNQGGALDEGYADFFSASFTGNPVLGEYTNADTGTGLVRDSSERRACPDDVTGEVHDDSRAWSSALWQLRTLLGTDAAKVALFEKAVFTGLATLHPGASYADAALASRTALVAAFPAAAGQVDEVFSDRGMSDCLRARALVRQVGAVTETQSIDSMDVAGTDATLLGNFVPAPFQWKMELPAGTNAFTLRFTAQGASMMGISTGGTTDLGLQLVFKRDTPITFTYSGNQVSQDGLAQSVTANNNGQVTYKLDVNETEASVYYVALTTAAKGGVSVTGVTAALDVTAAPDAGVPDAGSSSSSSSSSSSGGGGDDDDDGGSKSSGPCRCAGLPGSGAPVALLALLGVFLARRRR